MSVLLLFSVAALSADEAVNTALETVRPAPSLRAAFVARVSSSRAVREFTYNPFADGAERLKMELSYGADPELDRIAESWMASAQPDVRLFADDLPYSIEGVKVFEGERILTAEFDHRASGNDGPIEDAFTGRLRGVLQIEKTTGRPLQLDYFINEPVRMAAGARLTHYRQTYTFAHSSLWGVSYVNGYQLEASGGILGVAEARRFNVQISEVSFGFAGDARQELASRATP